MQEKFQMMIGKITVFRVIEKKSTLMYTKELRKDLSIEYLKTLAQKR